jgi:hypothetical protein
MKTRNKLLNLAANTVRLTTIRILLKTKHRLDVGLASRYTSFIAVDPKQQKSLKDSWMLLKSRDVPNTVAYGWGGLRSQMFNVVCDSAPSSTGYARDGIEEMDFASGSSHKESKDDLMKLVDAQRSDGSFSQTAVLAELLNTTLQDINDGK